jgi:hypothetical protein
VDELVDDQEDRVRERPRRRAPRRRSDIARSGAYENEITGVAKYLTFFASVQRDSPSPRATRSYGTSAVANPLQRSKPRQRRVDLAAVLEEVDRRAGDEEAVEAARGHLRETRAA